MDLVLAMRQPPLRQPMVLDHCPTYNDCMDVQLGQLSPVYAIWLDDFGTKPVNDRKKNKNRGTMSKVICKCIVLSTLIK